MLSVSAGFGSIIRGLSFRLSRSLGFAITFVHGERVLQGGISLSKIARSVVLREFSSSSFPQTQYSLTRLTRRERARIAFQLASREPTITDGRFNSSGLDLFLVLFFLFKSDSLALIQWSFPFSSLSIFIVSSLRWSQLILVINWEYCSRLIIRVVFLTICDDGKIKICITLANTYVFVCVCVKRQILFRKDKHFITRHIVLLPSLSQLWSFYLFSDKSQSQEWFDILIKK